MSLIDAILSFCIFTWATRNDIVSFCILIFTVMAIVSNGSEASNDIVRSSFPTGFHILLPMFAAFYQVFFL